MDINKKYYLFPLFILIGLLLILGLLSFLIPNHVINFLRGVWYGIKAPIIVIASAVNLNLSFYKNIESSKLYDFGFIVGILTWASPKIKTKKYKEH